MNEYSIAQRIRSLSERGFPIINIIAKSMGLSVRDAFIFIKSWGCNKDYLKKVLDKGESMVDLYNNNTCDIYIKGNNIVLKCIITE
jgi:hypothetical protein